MSDWIKAINPKAPIANEAEALQAARASALSIVIGVIVGVISLVWTVMNPQDVDAALAAAGTGSEAAAAESILQAGLWLAGGLIVVQAILAFVQWKDPKKFIAILFLALLAFGIVSTLATPMLAGLAPNVPATPVWQIVLSLAVMAVQVVMHVAGLRGMSRLNQIQMDAAR